MGCDIHPYVESRVDGEWQTADKWTPCSYADGALRIAFNDEVYSGRNYELFAILADVRNRFDLVPIGPLRGLPPDACPQVREACEGWDGDGHSHSWFTLAELLAYDWAQAATLSGWVGAVGYAQWDRRRRSNGLGPESYCQGVGGGNVRHITEDEMRQQLEVTKAPYLDGDYVEPWDDYIAAVKAELPSHYCQVEWQLAYYQCVPAFWASCMPRLAAAGNPDDVRLVFWFDN